MLILLKSKYNQLKLHTGLTVKHTHAFTYTQITSEYIQLALIFHHHYLYIYKKKLSSKRICSQGDNKVNRKYRPNPRITREITLALKGGCNTHGLARSFCIPKHRERRGGFLLLFKVMLDCKSLMHHAMIISFGKGRPDPSFVPGYRIETFFLSELNFVMIVNANVTCTKTSVHG